MFCSVCLFVSMLLLLLLLIILFQLLFGEIFVILSSSIVIHENCCYYYIPIIIIIDFKLIDHTHFRMYVVSRVTPRALSISQEEPAFITDFNIYAFMN